MTWTLCMCANANGKMVLMDVYGFHKPSVCKKMQYL